jgi:membrane-associated protease RseP (regulator of RpoE activity)
MKRLLILIPVLLFLVAGGYHAASHASTSRGGDEKKESRGAWLGVKLKSIEKIVDGKSEKSTGALVDEVIEDSPADSAGIETGDVIIACGNVEIADADDLIKAMRGSTPGEVMKITLLRDGEQKTLSVRLGTAKQRMFRVQKRITRPNVLRVPRPPRPPKMTWHQRTNYGFYLETLNSQLAEYFGAPDGKGVLIEKVREDSDAAKAGFKAGDVITRAGKKTVENVSDFKHVLGAYDAGEKIPVQVLRKGKSMSIELEAKEFDEEEHVIMKHFGDMGDMEFEWHGDDEEIIHLGGLSGLEELEDMDLDMNVDVDVDELEDGVRQLRIMLNGKELDLKELQEELREHLQDVEERIRVEVEEGEDGEMEVRVRKI